MLSISISGAQPTNVRVSPRALVIDNGSVANLSVSWGASTGPYTVDLYSGNNYTNCTQNTTAGPDFEESFDNASSPANFTIYPSSTTVFCAAVTDNNSAVTYSSQPDSALITVNSTLFAPNLTADQLEIAPGQTATITSEALTTGKPPYTYQWFASEGYNFSSSDTANALCGRSAQTTSCKFSNTSATTPDDYTFFLSVTDDTNTTAQSDPIYITVNTTFTQSNMTVTPSSPMIDAGQSASIYSSNVSVTPPFTYQWLASEGSGELNAESANAFCGASAQQAACLFPTTSSTTPDSYQFALLITNSSGATAESNPTSVQVSAPLGTPSITSLPTSVSQGSTETVVASSVEGTGSGVVSYTLLASSVPGGPFTSLDANCTLSQDTLSVSCSYIPQTGGTFYYEVSASDQASPSATAFSAPSQQVSVGSSGLTDLLVGIILLVVIGALAYTTIVKRRNAGKPSAPTPPPT
jgi:hypothetical protein